MSILSPGADTHKGEILQLFTIGLSGPTASHVTVRNRADATVSCMYNLDIVAILDNMLRF